MSNKPPKISSDFAILDVKLGRKALAKMFKNNSRRRIPIIIRGGLTGQWSNDDGESIEFSVDVDRVDVPAILDEAD